MGFGFWEILHEIFAQNTNKTEDELWFVGTKGNKSDKLGKKRFYLVWIIVIIQLSEVLVEYKLF